MEKLFPNYFTGFKNLHAPAAYTKSTFAAVWDAEPELLARTTSHRFRSAEDLNQWVCLWWQVASGQFASFNTDNVVSCINDPEKPVNFEVLSSQLRGAFETILPKKSGFEI